MIYGNIGTDCKLLQILLFQLAHNNGHSTEHFPHFNKELKGQFLCSKEDGENSSYLIILT